MKRLFNKQILYKTVLLFTTSTGVKIKVIICRKLDHINLIVIIPDV